jgi:Copper amine oxidase N-terminal domain.
MNRFKWGLVLSIMLFLMPTPALAGNSPSVYLDGQELSFDVPPVVVDGRLLVPLSGIFEALNLRVYWKEPNIVMCQETGEDLWLEVGSNTCWIRQKQVDLDVPAQIIDGRVMVPMRIVAEAAACKVAYDANNNRVTITRGEHQLVNYHLAQGYDEQIHKAYGAEKSININSPRTVAIASFTGMLSDDVLFEWYFCSNSDKELVSEQTTKPYYSNGYSEAISKLSREQYKLGKWVVVTKVNGQAVQEYNFTIVDDKQQYGTLDWIGGQYTGYLWEGKPGGYGQLLLDDGTTIEGDFNQSSIHCLFISEPLDTLEVAPNNSYTLDIYGRWVYPDGNEFIGGTGVQAVAKNKADMRAGKYTLYYYVEGDIKTKQGSTKHIKGFSKEFDPLYRFESITPGSVMDAIESGLIQM